MQFPGRSPSVVYGHAQSPTICASPGRAEYNAVRRESMTMISRMSGLPPGLPSGGVLEDRLGSPGRNGGGWDRRIGGVAIQLRLEVMNLFHEGGDPLECGSEERAESHAGGAARIGGWDRFAHGSQGYGMSQRLQE